MGKTKARVLDVGNCDPDLKGWHIRFEPSAPEDPGQPDDDSPAGIPETIIWQQVGSTGNMTAARKVKVTKCPPHELYMRCKAGEPPPFEWKRCLYLEWYGPNGRVVIELADPTIEYVEFVDLGGEAPDVQATEDEDGTAPGLAIQGF